jgi:hypothetical protein
LRAKPARVANSPNESADIYDSRPKSLAFPCVAALVFVEYQTAQVYTLYMETNCLMPLPTPRLTVVCAWCPDAAEQTAQAMRQGAEVTHGLCPTCAAALDADL